MQAATQQQKQNGPRVTSPNSKSQASPISAISNRYNKLLEFLVTYTKQTIGPSSNRYKNAVVSIPCGQVAPDDGKILVGAQGLLTVLRVYADAYVALGRDFQELEMLGEGFYKPSVTVVSASERSLNHSELETLVDLFVRVRNHCEKLGLQVCAKIAGKINDDFEALGELSWDVVQPRLAELRRCFVAEIETRKCYMILPGRESYYTDDPLVFLDNSVIERFPSVRFDIIEAAKCFATERFTASVGHLMKVAEYALVSLSHHAKLERKDWDNWNTALNHIHSKLRDKKEPFDKISKQEETYFTELEGYLRTAKTAWRNPASHIPKIFIESQARALFEVIRILMSFAGQKLSEVVEFRNDETENEAAQ